MLHLLELLGHGNQCHQAPGADFVQMLMAEELCSYGVRRVLVTFTHYVPPAVAVVSKHVDFTIMPLTTDLSLSI